MTTLDLQTSQQQWVRGQHDDQWVIKSADNERELGRLPAGLTPEQVMQIVRFARTQQMLGFELGVAEGLRRGAAASKANRDLANATIHNLREERAQMLRTIEVLERYPTPAPTE